MDKYFKFIQDLLGTSEQLSKILGIAVPLVVLCLIILVIVLVSKANKKKKEKTRKQIQQRIQEEADDEEIIPECLPTEEIKPEMLREVEDYPVEKKQVIDPKVIDDEDTTKTVHIDTKELEDILREQEQEEVEKPKPVKKHKKEDKSRVLVGKFEIFPVNDVFLYRLRASNGEIIVTSEIYKSQNGAKQAIDSIKENIENGDLQIAKDKHGLWQFKFFAANKRLLVVSANYPTEQGCQSAAESFKKFVPISQIVLLTEDPDHLHEEIKIKILPNKPGGKIVIIKQDGEYSFQVQAANGSILCSSSDYKSKSAVDNGIQSFTESIRVGRFIVVRDKNNMYQYKLYNPNGRCIILGQAYKSKAQAVSAAHSLVSYISQAKIVNQSGD